MSTFYAGKGFEYPTAQPFSLIYWQGAKINTEATKALLIQPYVLNEYGTFRNVLSKIPAGPLFRHIT